MYDAQIPVDERDLQRWYWSPAIDTYRKVEAGVQPHMDISAFIAGLDIAPESLLSNESKCFQTSHTLDATAKYLARNLADRYVAPRSGQSSFNGFWQTSIRSQVPR